MRRNSIDGVEWVGASGLIAGERLRSYRKGRICAKDGCGTHLSRYNSDTRCSIH